MNRRNSLNILLVSCQHIEKKTSAILEKEEALEKWIGQPKLELLEVYGLPTEVRKDDRGIEFLIYTSKITLEYPPVP